MKISDNIKIELLTQMLRVRLFEEKIVAEYGQQEMKTPVHLCIGQEAVSAGVGINLRKEDYLFSTHRNHGHYLTKGADMRSITAELYGKKTGCSKAKGGSMHFVDETAGCMGTTAIVGGSIPLAAGAALAAKLRKEDRISVACFGDGASDEGVLQETLNFAALKDLPVLFLCENNFYATNSHQSARHADDNIAKRAQAFSIETVRLDGNDVESIFAAAKEAVSYIRKGNGPYFMECTTYRWKGHVGPECDHEKGCRPKAELDKWMEKCPIKVYKAKLLADKTLTDKHYNEICDKIRTEVEHAWSFAKESPFPEASDLASSVYS